MKTFKTPKGTELPFLNLKGKDYLLVPHRVLWMREEHPEWSIESHFLQLTESIAIAQATIRDDKGKIVAQGTKSETPQGFSEYIEKAESGAIGRALAFCGYGTQFAQELEAGESVADAPIAPPKANGGQAAAPKHDKAPNTDAMGREYREPMVTRKISEAQLKRLFAIQKTANVSDEALKAICAEYGFKSRTEITNTKYNEIVTRIENTKTKELRQ